jgi:KUP system potassium uptake protein
MSLVFNLPSTRFAVATVMIVTTTLITIQIPYVKGYSWVLAAAWMLSFGFIDTLFWGASLKKVPLGAWVPLLVGVIA